MQSTPRLIPLPLYTQVLIAVACGTLLGVVFGQEPYLGGLKNEHLGWLGLLLVTLLKTLAIPLIFFAILDALVRTSFPQADATRALWLTRYSAFAIASGADPGHAQNARAAVEAHLNILTPEQDEAILREAGFSHVSLFYAAFTWRGWVAYA